MAVLTSPSSSGNEGRKRKTHKKSRRGCANCKIRRVKCDEHRPSCQKCVSYGVSCNYNQSGDGDLNLLAKGTVNVGTLQYRSPSPGVNKISSCGKSLNPLPINTELIRQLHPSDLATLNRFQERTVFTVGTERRLQLYQKDMVQLASHTPSLMHILLALTLMHDRYLSGASDREHTTAEAFHRYQGTALFNQILSRPVADSEKDGLWACAAMLGAITLANIDATRAEEAWPLAAASPSDLEWLRISDGKKTVFKIADLSRSSSTFQSLLPDHEQAKQFLTLGDIDLSVLSQDFIAAYDLDDPSTKVDSPYYGPILIVSRLMTIEINHNTILKFLAFITGVNPEYKRLLELKEPRALVVLAWWFALVIPYNIWWVEKRVRLECQAICIYLERYHKQERDLLRLLQFPKRMCGLS